MIRRAGVSVVLGLSLVGMIAAWAGAGQAAHGYLGVGLAGAPQGAPPGAMIARVDPNGPAARAGLLTGDLIRSVNGQAVPDALSLQNYVLAQHAGAVLTFDVVRSTPSGLSSSRVTVTLASTPGANPAPSAEPSGRTAHASPRAAPAAPAPLPATAGPPSDVRFVVYRDPAENAFTEAVPAGWRVGGRMVRYGPISIAPFVQAMTPDGTIFVQIGDWHIKDYCDLPGWPEGKLYTPGTSIEYVRRLQTAEQYTHAYSLSFQKQLGCDNPTFTNSQSVATPPGTATIPQARVDTHLAEFTCQRGGQAFSGRVMATMQAYQLPMGSVGWNIVYLACVLARQDRTRTGFGVWEKMRTSFAWDSNWNAREAMIARQATRPSIDALNNTLKQSQDFDKHVINSTVTVNDPTTGTKWDVSMGAAPFYFTDGIGHFYNSYDPTPKSGFHAVNTLP